MAPEDLHPPIIERARPGATEAGRPPALAEGPSGIQRRETRTEKLQMELRGNFPSISANMMFNPITSGVTADAFFFSLVGSMLGTRTMIFGDREVSVISLREPAYVEPPMVNGKKLRPVVAHYLVYGEISPETMAQDPKVSGAIHSEHFIEFSPEGGKKKYLFPAEPGLLKSLTILSEPPQAKLAGGTEEERKSADLSNLEAYLPKDTEGARKILLAASPFGDNFLNLLNIHDTLESVAVVTFSGDEKKTSLPFASLQVAGGAKYSLYPYGIKPPMGPIPDGCALFSSEEVYFLLIPEARIPALLSRGLPSQGKEEGI